MSNDKTNGSGPAFPEYAQLPDGHGGYYPHFIPGLSLRQYAAIKLRVPDSGEEWLDEMILRSLRDEFAGRAMQGLIASPNTKKTVDSMEVANDAWGMASDMLKAREQ